MKGPNKLLKLKLNIAPLFDILLCLSVSLSCTLFPYWLASLPSLGCASGCQTSKQTGNKVQRETDKQSKMSKGGAIKCSKEISSPTLKYEWRNIPFCISLKSSDYYWPKAQPGRKPGSLLGRTKKKSSTLPGHK